MSIGPTWQEVLRDRRKHEDELVVAKMKRREERRKAK